MDINHIITLGIGTPADIAHFILVGLSPDDSVVVPPVLILDAFFRLEGPSLTPYRLEGE